MNIFVRSTEKIGVSFLIYLVHEKFLTIAEEIPQRCSNILSFVYLNQLGYSTLRSMPITGMILSSFGKLVPKRTTSLCLVSNILERFTTFFIISEAVTGFPKNLVWSSSY